MVLSSDTAGREGVGCKLEEGLFCFMDWYGNLCQQGRQGLQVKAGLGFTGPALIWERLEESPLHLGTNRHICELCGDIARCV